MKNIDKMNELVGSEATTKQVVDLYENEEYDPDDDLPF